MKHPRRPRLALVALLLALPVVLTGCGGASNAASTPSPASGDDGPQIATLTATTQLVEATPEPSATPPPTAEPTEPASPTPEPQVEVVGLSFEPPQLLQGGFVTVYLNENAANATASFGGRQYPMLQDGARWWALLGIGAFSETGLAPVTVAYTPAGGGDVTSVTQSIDILPRDYPVENIDLDPETSALLDPEVLNNELAIRASVLSGYTASKLWSGEFVRPGLGAISSIYGIGRSYNGGPVSGYHHGTDFIGDIGDPVYAAGAGIVVFTGELQVRGNAIMIDHGAGLFTAYHHLSAIHVNQGDLVTPGQLIGDIGSTGLVTGPHLHWEVIIRSIEIDGELLLGAAVGP